MMRTLTVSRFLTLLLYAVPSLYLALRSNILLSEIALTLSSISEGAEPSTVRVPNESRRKRHASLPNGLAHCINSFEQYPFLAEQIIQRKYGRFAKQTPAQKALSNKLGYAEHFTKAREGIETNAQFTNKVARIAREKYHTGPQALGATDDADFGLVDMTFGHLSRDWTSQGTRERQAVFPPILDGLNRHFNVNGNSKKVLVPGSGMGRLASDIADLGYDVTANEMDYSSILTYHLLANHTTSLHQHSLQPFVTKWTHQANPSSRYSTLTLPDHWPNKAVQLVEGDFLDIFPQDSKFDAVVTLFFIDMANNTIDFLSNIHRLLKPGGVWINLGPLKWGTHSALQLSTEEVLQLADLLGFDVDHTSRKSIDSLYAEQPETLLKFTYVTQFWQATKRM
ncbi:methyltransferase-like protein [Emericellopsis atlantica]|uniref:Methyltransferase-like protein n=1 Tax=Emericellopsis atlantica TaxID=2614577 RepID=A0A9P8CTV5_9HYPO|nr:methyltransferase-like protein [Emericellopsis atlantica]KAG9258585.1 methyltransferase-like protein [Emericellopsis atlantica]